MAHSFDNTPNTDLPFEVLTSYNSDIFDGSGGVHGGGDAGFGTLSKRDVSTEVVMYKPYRNALDTVIQTTGGFEVATNSVHEWTENDELLDDEAVGVDETDNGQINKDSGTYTAAGTGDFVVTDDNAKIFRKGDVVRYVDSNGAYTYALILSISTSDGGSNTALELGTIDGTNLASAASDAVIHRMHSLRGSDLNYDVEPRGSIANQYYTYLNKIVHDERYGKRVQNEEHYYDLLADTEAKLFKDMRRSRELQALYGVKGKRTLSNGDIAYSSPGLYTQIADFNKDTSSMTSSGSFDKDLFTNAIYDFIAHNFGGESGGPETRTMFISGQFADYLSRAFIDRQRFYETEYIAGVRAMRFVHNLGNIDFIYLPILDYKHPIPGGSLKESSPKAVGMLCPVQECVTRLVMQGEGPSSEVFLESGGDEEENMRVKTTEGLKLKLKQYCAVLEES
jgi:hypothetical protein